MSVIARGARWCRLAFVLAMAASAVCLFGAAATIGRLASAARAVDVVMMCQGGTNPAVAMNDIQHAFWHTRLERKLRDPCRGE